MRVQVTLDSVGCLSVLVLAIAIHWTLVTHLGASGFGSGLAVWSVAIVAGLAIVARISSRAMAREDGRAREAFARAACPWCGVPVGDAGAAAIREESQRACDAARRDGMRRGVRVNTRRDWCGPCPTCHEPIAFDRERGTIGVDRLAPRR